MAILLRFLAILWVLWAILRIFRFPKRKPQAQPRPDPGTAACQDTVKDPVCGMYMDPRLAIRTPGKEGDVFFCSEECRQRYLNRP
ncbi:MAG: hypothetical protein ABSC02_04540 [Acidobacteriota bacterium]